MGLKYRWPTDKTNPQSGFTSWVGGLEDAVIVRMHSQGSLTNFTRWTNTPLLSQHSTL